MPTFSASFTATSLPELIFLSPQNPTKKRKISLYKPHNLEPRWNIRILGTRIRAVQREESAVLDENDSVLATKLNSSVNGSNNGKSSHSNGSVRKYTNGSVKVESGNRDLVKYVNGNGNVGVKSGVEVVKVDEVISNKKKSIEEIGQEDAWFKQKGQDQVEVSVAPGGRWSRFKTYSTIQRTLEIWGFVLSFIFKAWLNNQKFSYRGRFLRTGTVLDEIIITIGKKLKKWLKENILRLGPTFIKIGQQFSTRVDILAQEYVDQLSELQDQVPPFPSETAVSIVEEELGGPIDGIFQRFDREPIAAASLGQVHRAKLKGHEVVVKVQRPGLKDLFDIDLKNLRVIAEYLQKFDPKSDGAKRDWVAIYDECASVLYQVLVMEYVPGIKINRIRALDQLGVDRKRPASMGRPLLWEDLPCGKTCFYGKTCPRVRPTPGLAEDQVGILRRSPPSGLFKWRRLWEQE
ncbi:hypothetical protein DH2020_047821 [Rehmannia glutinosa]|uniref:ABC1 atypical kinase-like domain-containing protein n=1 Tax=Rehmannia glutinosa TaxID=99300 RepID=A0ABR0U7B2_REHGL